MMDKNFIIKKIMMKLVIIGAINWGLIGLLDFNLVEYLNEKFLGNNDVVVKVIYLVVGLSALGLFQRDSFLPFLGRTVYPCADLKEKIPNYSDSKITVKVKPNSNVVYWAAEKNNNKIDNPWDAYEKYANSGVVKSDENGDAVLKFKFPAQYYVPRKGLLPPHVHYRVCDKDGMMTRVETVNLRR
jgi:uncharacterized membrane protein YuzA (DUF378 family)